MVCEGKPRHYNLTINAKEPIMDGSTAPAAPSTPFFKSAEGIAIANFLPVLNNINAAVQGNQANASIQNIVGGEGLSWLAQLQAAIPNLQESETQFLIGYLVSQAQAWAAGQTTPLAAPKPPAP